MDGRTVGVLGGGQLGRMMAEAGHRLGIKLAVLDPGGVNSPAGQVAELAIEGSFQDPSKISELSSVSDIITTEIEHVNADVLKELEDNGRIVQPSSSTIKLIQDKYLQKTHLASFNINLPDFMDTPSVHDVLEAGKKFGYPFMLKNKRLAYDGRGNAVVKSEADCIVCYKKLGENDLYAEEMILFVKELAVMVVRTANDVLCYPVVETIQQDNICHLVKAPAHISNTATKNALEVARSAIATLTGKGIFGVELFLLPDDSILLNEIAPRPHNSGHYTMEACDIDQFEMHLRAILDLPCPAPNMRVKFATMINILGTDTMEETMRIPNKSLSVPGASMHWYGKNENRKGRKMAHITITANDEGTLRTRLRALGVSSSSDEMNGGDGDKLVRVGIIMGSDSDLPTMSEAAKILDHFAIPYEITVVSAHRTPSRMYTYAQNAVERGLQVIIAGAGGAAHLPGMVAALTSLPVIGVPVKSSALSGNDSLLSIVQMPKGIPVATVAIGNAANAGLLAVRILGAGDAELLRKMDDYMATQEEEVLEKAARMESIGYEKYLETMKTAH
eukprot:gene164-280_t